MDDNEALEYFRNIINTLKDDCYQYKVFTKIYDMATTERIENRPPQFTDVEKEFLELLFSIGYKILETQGTNNMYLKYSGGYFDGNDLYKLSEKLGDINYC